MMRPAGISKEVTIPVDTERETDLNIVKGIRPSQRQPDFHFYAGPRKRSCYDSGACASKQEKNPT
jgi:hypothetical protein